MSKRKTRKEKIKASNRALSAPTPSSHYSLPKGYEADSYESPVKREISDLAMLSYAWVGRDIRKSLTVSGLIFLAFALILVVT